MANKYFKSQFNFSADAKPVTLRLHITIGATGAPTLDAPNSIGAKSIVRNSAGNYTITLKDPYKQFRYMEMTNDTSGNSGAVPAAPGVYIKAQNVSASTGGTINFVCGAYSGASGAFVATDPANGEALWIELQLNDSSVKY